MRERRHDLVEEAVDLEHRRDALFAEQRALRDDPIHVERLHRGIFGSVSSEHEVRVQVGGHPDDLVGGIAHGSVRLDATIARALRIAAMQRFELEANETA